MIAKPVTFPASSVAVTSTTLAPSWSGTSTAHTPEPSAVTATPAMTMLHAGVGEPADQHVVLADLGCRRRGSGRARATGGVVSAAPSRRSSSSSAVVVVVVVVASASVVGVAVTTWIVVSPLPAITAPVIPRNATPVRPSMVPGRKIQSFAFKPSPPSVRAVHRVPIGTPRAELRLVSQVRRALRRWSRPPAGRCRRRPRWSTRRSAPFGLGQHVRQQGSERHALRRPEVPGQRAGDRVDLVDVELVVRPQEVDAGDRPHQSNPCDGRWPPL